MRVKGRIWLVLWVVFILVILAWVIRRDTAGYMTASRLDSLRTHRSVLVGQRTDLRHRISRASSREVLIPRAESLGLRESADSEIVILPVPLPERR
ncbi:MAG: hypothetical protein JSW51_00840 [Gemmatimonadota bacterium]|nr:MAG: hypothetical protein JSW51_00840 [Gemmatimonadota bacterium]